MPLIGRNLREKRKNICISAKKAVILHPQSGNDAAQK